MGKKLDEQLMFKNIFIWLEGKSEVTSSGQEKAYQDFCSIFEKAARKTLYNVHLDNIYDQMTEVLESLIISISRNGIPDDPKAYIDTTIRNGLKKLFGSKADAYKVVKKKSYAEMLESLENSGKIYSNSIRVSVDSALEGDSIDEYSIYGHIYDLVPNYEKLNEDFVLDLLKKINRPVEKTLLLNQIVNYLHGETEIIVSLDGDDSSKGEDDYSITQFPIADEQLMQDELADISLFTERVMKKIDEYAESENTGKETFIKLLYLTMTTKTSKQIAEITGMASKNVEYYTSARANKSTRSLIKQWVSELAALLVTRNRDEIILIFQDEIMGKMKVKYESYLKGIE